MIDEWGNWVQDAALAAAREWNSIEEHVADVLHPRPSRQSQQEEPVSSPVTAALAAVWQQAAALESDVTSNPLAVILSARHVGKSFTPAECVALADFIAAVENERRDRQQAPARDTAPANGAGRLTGPQQVLNP